MMTVQFKVVLYASKRVWIKGRDLFALHKQHSSFANFEIKPFTSDSAYKPHKHIYKVQKK
jgi:hypothetical protein